MKKVTTTVLLCLGLATPFSAVNADPSLNAYAGPGVKGLTIASQARAAAAEKQQEARERQQERVAAARQNALLNRLSMNMNKLLHQR